jgi:transcription elongation factor GreA
MVHYVSADGLARLEQELRELKNVGRREGAARIEAAKALGDLSENAEYHEAKEAMALIEGRIMELENIIKDAAVIEEQVGVKGVVSVGSTVKVSVNGKEKTYMIVGSNEADPLTGKISNESPIGSALLGAKVGEQVEVETPAGINVYHILTVT